MDRAQEIFVQALKHQIPMNEVIDRGDSDVQQFYSGATVFVTGGSGFLGKQIIEKLLRSCNLKKMFVLLRPKKGKTIQERLDYLLKDPVYDFLREKKPNFLEKLVPLEGDVADVRLGLSQEDWTLLTQEVETVFHMAATVRFDEPLKAAVVTNVRGTRECLALSKECVNFKNFIYVSTAFSHATYDRVNTEVLDQFYPCPVQPETIIGMAESMEEDRLNSITEDLIVGWPNTYTFTKAIAEELVRTYDPDLPVCVVRPPIVTPTYYEPTPGWMDLSALSGPTGILAGIIMGFLHIFYVDKDCKLPLTPVDYVNNATIAAAWDADLKRKSGNKDIQVYTVSNNDHFITWDFIGVILRSEGKKSPSPKAVWYCWLIETNSKLVFWVISFFVHYIPAYIMDLVLGILGNMPKEINSFVAVFRKIDKFALIYHYFLSNEWFFKDHNVQEMVSRMSPADKAIFNCDLRTIDFTEYVMVWGVGIRKYLVKDELKDSELAYRKQQKLKIANILFISLNVIVVLSLFYQLFKVVIWLF
ncbi:fatty acyl-CoA reductase wat [Helicoverpa armigera]|uniref:fatty acyl-CoA reductase wat n=1 Tax=Helicoverpa armigera TaxID=29058 RepID=UPI003082A90A